MRLVRRDAVIQHQLIRYRNTKKSVSSEGFLNMLVLRMMTQR